MIVTPPVEMVMFGMVDDVKLIRQTRKSTSSLYIG